jgi:hypothetical protein
MAKPKDADKPDEERFADRDRDWMSGSGKTVGDPHGLRFATGRRNVDVSEVGEEMLRGHGCRTDRE